MPWSLSFFYQADVRKVPYASTTVGQSINLNGNITLSEFWKVQFSSGYDFRLKQVNMTSLGITRDLHCWQLDIYWIPFGNLQSYNVTIRAKASMLRDLKVDKKDNWYDRGR